MVIVVMPALLENSGIPLHMLDKTCKGFDWAARLKGQSHHIDITDR